MTPSREFSRAVPALGAADRAAAAALRELPEGLVIVFDSQMRFVLAAGQALERLGNPLTCSPGQVVSNAFPSEIWSRVEPLFESALLGETRTREIWTSGERHCLMVDVGPLTLSDAEDGSGEPDGGIAVVLDITARRQADVIVAQPRGGFEEVFESAPVGTGLLDRDGRWLLVNRALCEITGYTSAELIGKRFEGIIHPDDVANDLELRTRLLTGELPAIQVEKRYFDASGETVQAIVSMSLVRDPHGAPVHYIAQVQDISERKQLEEHLRNLGDHDPLTGVRNRRLFEHDLKLQVARSQRYGEVAGLIVVGLDGFSEVNSSYGSDAGDALLRTVARALTRRLRETDLVARLGGDRFAVILPHIDDDGMAVVIEGLGRVIPACGIDAGAGVVHPRASIGRTIIDEQTGTAEQALAEAEAELQSAKRSLAAG